MLPAELNCLASVLTRKLNELASCAMREAASSKSNVKRAPSSPRSATGGALDERCEEIVSLPAWRDHCGARRRGQRCGRDQSGQEDFRVAFHALTSQFHDHRPRGRETIKTCGKAIDRHKKSCRRRR